MNEAVPQGEISKVPESNGTVAPETDQANQTPLTANEPESEPAEKSPVRGVGLSGKLLLLTIAFVMISEVLIYAPSIANFRKTWMEDRISQARLAARVFDTASVPEIPDELKEMLLKDIGAYNLALKRGDMRQMLAVAERPDTMVDTVDLRSFQTVPALFDAFALLAKADPPPLRIVGDPGALVAPEQADNTDNFIEVVIDQATLRQAMLDYSFNILRLSILISVLTAGLVYLSLNWLFVRPMRRITETMVAFSQAPEDGRKIIEPSSRRDEIGVAERELAAMQRQLSETLNQKSRLAALGLAVSKVNHDLRNLLASAQLIGDRVMDIDDPAVQRFAPKLLATLDRAISFCTATLRYGRAEEAPPRLKPVVLRPVVDDVATTVRPQDTSPIQIDNAVPADLKLNADPEHLFRILVNLTRNAIQAIEAQKPAHPEDGPTKGRVCITAQHHNGEAVIHVTDSGPGVPKRARDKLFQAFGASTTSGGTGLGLAIAAELIRAHGGSIALVEPESATQGEEVHNHVGALPLTGARFEIRLPR